jgi:hypothetical protein
MLCKTENKFHYDAPRPLAVSVVMRGVVIRYGNFLRSFYQPAAVITPGEEPEKYSSGT